VAHEINNPLAFVHSNLEYALEGLDDLKKRTVESKHRERLQALEEALEESVDGTRRVREIVRDLKSFSRERKEAREPVDLREAVKSAINMGWHEIRKSAKVRTEYDDVPEVLASEGRLGQVVLNLVVNAAQAFGENSDREHNFITVRTMREDDYGLVEVEDNGRGIPHENLRRIFDPFFTTKPLGEGTGLGLWISQDIIARMGGSIEVESEVGRGTLFQIRLPYADPTDFEAPAEVSIATESSSTDEAAEPTGLAERTSTTFRRTNTDEGRVLVIDDEPMIARLITRVLSDEVVSFTDPNQAIRHLRDDDDFDVVLCDATMPGMTGVELFGKLQAEYPELAERFVLITGGLTSRLEKAEQIPRLVTKPFDMNHLRSLVREVRETHVD
jgi:CheY-like chemotaxis protein